MSNVTPPDIQQRTRMETDLDTNFLVEAGAGSGKTTQLVKRMLALVKSGKAQVGEIAAITFTRKAAAQLRQRFQVRLEQECRQAVGEERARLATALQDFDRCFIGTVHSFCSRLIRERALEAGVDPAFREIEGMEERLLEQQCWDEYMEHLRFAGTLEVDNLSRLGVAPADLQTLYRTLAASPDVEPAAEERPAPEFGAVREAVQAFLRTVAERLPATVPDKGWDGVQAAVRRALGLRQNLDLQAEHSVIRVLEALDKPGAKVTQNRWPSKEIAKEMEALFHTFRQTQVEPTLQQWREYLHSQLLAFVRPAVAHYAQRRRERSVLNFADQLMTATALLREHPAVRRYFAERYPRLLVDEFQDTDPIQAELMMLLAGEPYDERNWRRVKPRPGALFVVGDPRQSIYRFRRADITVYQQFKELLVAAGGEVLTLDANFRSLDAIGAWVNTAFQALMPEQANACQAAYHPMATLHPNPADDAFHGIYQIAVPKVPYHRKDAIAEFDADRIARFVAWACAGNLTVARTPDEVDAGLAPTARPGDFLILTRQRDRLDLYARALERFGVPYTVSGSKGFGQELTIQQLIVLLQAIADPEDTVALAGALRGLYVGLPDDLLYRFVKQGGKLHYLATQSVDRHEFAPVLTALDKLKQYWQDARRLPAGVVVERIVSDLGIVPYMVAGEMGNSRAGNLLRALELLRATGAAGLNEALRQWEMLLEGSDIEEGQVVPESQNAVRLMNLHKAKGLEAHVVFLADPTTPADHAPSAHVRRAEDASVGYYLVERSRGYQVERLAQPTGWDAWAEEEQKYEEAEEQRLLYVACTRAHSALVVSRYPDKEDAAWSPLSPWLTGEPELPDVAVQPVQRPEVRIDAHELSESMAVLAETRSAAAQAAYVRETVTGLVHAAGTVPPWQDTEDGRSWGQAVHQFLADMVRTRRDRLELAHAALRSAGRGMEEADRLIAVADAWLRTELGRRSVAALERHAEVPVSVARGGMLLSGVIDLAFREAGGWVLVDFKTDSLGAVNREELVRYYSPQLLAYAGMWRETTGEAVKERLLYFTDRHVAVPV